VEAGPGRVGRAAAVAEEGKEEEENKLNTQRIHSFIFFF
jgi:hypothetical protein